MSSPQEASNDRAPGHRSNSIEPSQDETDGSLYSSPRTFLEGLSSYSSPPEYGGDNSSPAEDAVSVTGYPPISPLPTRRPRSMMSDSFSLGEPPMAFSESKDPDSPVASTGETVSSASVPQTPEAHASSPEGTYATFSVLVAQHTSTSTGDLERSFIRAVSNTPCNRLRRILVWMFVHGHGRDTLLSFYRTGEGDHPHSTSYSPKNDGGDSRSDEEEGSAETREELEASNSQESQQFVQLSLHVARDRGSTPRTPVLRPYHGTGKINDSDISPLRLSEEDHICVVCKQVYRVSDAGPQSCKYHEGRSQSSPWSALCDTQSHS